MSSGVLERLESMLAAGKETALLRYGLGLEYLKRHDPERACEHFAAAVSLDPGHSAAWKQYGRALSDAGRFADATDAYRRGIAAAQGKGDVQAVKEMRVFLRRVEKRTGA